MVKDGKKGFKEGIYFLLHRLNLVKKVSMKVYFEITLNLNVGINRQHLKGLTLSECLTYIYLTKLSINTCTFPNNHVYFYSLGRYIKDHFTAFYSVFHIAYKLFDSNFEFRKGHAQPTAYQGTVQE